MAVEDFRIAARYAMLGVRYVQRYGLRKAVLLNINVPYLPVEQIKGIQTTQLGMRDYYDRVQKRLDPRGEPYYWVVSRELPGGMTVSDTDVAAVRDGYVSITPVALNSTETSLLPSMQYVRWSEDEHDLLEGFPVSVSSS